MSSDYSKPVEIADRIWWVGERAAGRLTCNSYLIEADGDSVLIDPGPRSDFDRRMAKIEEIVPFDHIRWFVCHHQDPDIVGSLPLIESVIARDDAAVVAHWRNQVLSEALVGDALPFWLVDEHDWMLELSPGRCPRFVFTPYMHFPGAFTTFDESSSTLFSSDIFGAITAEDEALPFVLEDMSDFDSCFGAIRRFHEHYMPSSDILRAGLARLGALKPALIAPQHRPLIPAPMIPEVIARLSRVDCGLFLQAGADTDLWRLSEMQRQITETVRTISRTTDFSEVVEALASVTSAALNTAELTISFRDGENWVVQRCDAHGCKAAESKRPRVGHVSSTPEWTSIGWTSIGPASPICRARLLSKS